MGESSASRPVTYPATASDFANWQAKARSMSVAELLYSARDAREAEAAMRFWNPIAEGRYTDEACTYEDEIRRRRRRRRLNPVGQGQPPAAPQSCPQWLGEPLGELVNLA